MMWVAMLILKPMAVDPVENQCQKQSKGVMEWSYLLSMLGEMHGHAEGDGHRFGVAQSKACIGAIIAELSADEGMHEHSKAVWDSVSLENVMHRGDDATDHGFSMGGFNRGSLEARIQRAPDARVGFRGAWGSHGSSWNQGRCAIV